MSRWSRGPPDFLRSDSISLLANLLLTTNLLIQPTPAIPSISAVELADKYAPNAQIWRQQAEERQAEINRLNAENQRLRDEIERLKAQEWKAFTATAYMADCAEGCTGITATGLNVRATTHHEGKRVIATDPTVIPLGTTVEIRFRDGTVERAIAVDTGGAIDGNIIDYLVADYGMAVQFGRQTVEIRIIREA